MNTWSILSLYYALCCWYGQIDHVLQGSQRTWAQWTAAGVVFTGHGYEVTWHRTAYLVQPHRIAHRTVFDLEPFEGLTSEDYEKMLKRPLSEEEITEYQNDLNNLFRSLIHGTIDED